MKTTFVLLILITFTLTAISAPKPVSTSGSLVWTNDTSDPSRVIKPLDTTNVFIKGPPNVNESLHLLKPGSLELIVGNAEVQLVESTNQNNTTAIDIYGYENGDSTFTAAIAMGLDGTYADCLSLDPALDLQGAVVPFKFSTVSNKVIAATATLFNVQNAHNVKLALTGEGVISANGYSFLSSLSCVTNCTAARLTFARGTNQVVALPDAATVPNSMYTIVAATNNGSAIATNFNGSQLVLGGLSVPIAATNRLTVISDGVNWW